MYVFGIPLRPICIPCTQETSNALRLVGSSTCAEQGDEEREDREGVKPRSSNSPVTNERLVDGSVLSENRGNSVEETSGKAVFHVRIEYPRRRKRSPRKARGQRESDATHRVCICMLLKKKFFYCFPTCRGKNASVTRCRPKE